jgi:hypothetical protein
MCWQSPGPLGKRYFSGSSPTFLPNQNVDTIYRIDLSMLQIEAERQRIATEKRQEGRQEAGQSH